MIMLDDDMTIVQNFAKNLKAEMEKRDLSYRDMEKATKVSRNTIHQYVTGKAKPQLKTALNIARYLGKTIEEMIRE